MNKLNSRQLKILGNFELDSIYSPKEIVSRIEEPVSLVTISRDLSKLLRLKFISKIGSGPSTKYQLTSKAFLFRPIDYEKYFSTDIDKRKIISGFNFDIFKIIKNSEIFDSGELLKLKELQQKYQDNLKKLSETIIKKEIERVTIELSWKSSVIEGNTYSLLDTENLLKEGIEAEGKKKEESVMLINHKSAIDLIFNKKEMFKKISLAKIEHIHKIITENLDITSNLRKTLVGITGTKYKPLDNQFQIEDAMKNMVDLINYEPNVFVKSLLIIILTSYIQPFEDGNKRTSRILGNAVLLANNYFPLPLRSVDENVYKQATLLFYEQNNLSLFKRLFIEQCQFSVENYFSR